MRVVAGMYGGRRLQTLAGTSTRPTTERVREALFNVLGGRVQGARVLDGYAGSGALGIEALSRHAELAVFVEKGRAAAEVLRRNLRALSIAMPAQARVVEKALERSVASLQGLGPFDIWLIDPPFALVRDGAVGRTLTSLLQGGLLVGGGLVVLEYPSDAQCPEVSGLGVEDIRHYGDSHLALMAVHGSGY